MTIPKCIHQIWIQGFENAPEKQKNFITNNQNMGIEHVMWDEDKIKMELPNDLLKMYKRTKSYAQKADIARYWILYNYGGLYVDADAEIKKLPMDIWNEDFVASKTAMLGTLLINNGVIACKRKSKVMGKILEFVKSNYKNCDNWLCVFKLGPYGFTKIIKDNINLEKVKLLNHELWEPCFVGKLCKNNQNVEIRHEHDLSWIDQKTMVSIVVLIVAILLARKMFYLKK
jgi:inositol phosphorylceramide mannosyltransferase catalytic subunit